MRIISNYIKHTLVMVAFVICNLFLCSSVCALENNVLEYTSEIDTLIGEIVHSFTMLKSSDEYHDSKIKALSVYFENVFVSKVRDYRKMVASVETIDLETIVNESNDETLKLKYKEHGENMVISMNHISDIFCRDDSTSLLISKESIHKFFIEKYFVSYYDLFLDYSQHFRNYLFSNENLYDELFLKIDFSLSSVNDVFAEINDFEQAELALGNQPLMVIDKKSVYDSLNSFIDELRLLKDKIDLGKIEETNKKIDSVVSDVNNLKKLFFDKNASYQDNGLKEKIEKVDHSYHIINDSLEKKSDVFDKETIGLYKEVIFLENDYVQLCHDISDYLLRKSSDTFLLNTLTFDLRAIYQNLNREVILKEIENRISEESFHDIKTIELYEQLLDIDFLDDYYKQIIIDARNRMNKNEIKNVAKVAPVFHKVEKSNNSINVNVSKVEEESDLYELPALSHNEDSAITIEDEEVVDWVNIFKISLIVFLGALIIYFLNKGEEELMEVK